MPSATLVSESAPGWAPGTHLYSTSDGRYLAVEATDPGDDVELVIKPGDSPGGDDILLMIGETEASLKVVVRPTVIFLCNEEGQAIDAEENDFDPLTPLHTFPAGTTHAEALQAAGYTLT